MLVINYFINCSNLKSDVQDDLSTKKLQYHLLFFRKLEWIPIHNLFEIRKNQMIFNVLRSSTPNELCKLFTTVHEAHKKYTRSSLINLSFPSVSSKSAKSKLSYRGALLFSSLPCDLELIYNYTYSTYIKKLKIFFRNMNF